MGRVTQVAVLDHRHLMDIFLIKHFCLMTISFKTERQSPGLFPVFCRYCVAALALVLLHRLMGRQQLLGQTRRPFAYPRSSLCFLQLLIHMAGDAELVPAIDPQKIFFPGTGSGLASLYDTFLMRIMAGAAKDAVTVKR